jgi:pseudaminic acid cytidylyltransferase
MIAYAIEVARNSRLFERIVVSTDDYDIASLADSLGAQCPFIRSADLADDYTPTVNVVVNAIEQCISLNWKIDFVCCIYPCVPFLKIETLIECFNLLLYSKQDYAFPVIEFPSKIQRALARRNDGKMFPLERNHTLTRSQDLLSTYYDSGQFYWGLRDIWLTQPDLRKNCVGSIIGQWDAIDIDTPEDWERAEWLYSLLKKYPKT